MPDENGNPTAEELEQARREGVQKARDDIDKAAARGNPVAKDIQRRNARDDRKGKR